MMKKIKYGDLIFFTESELKGKEVVLESDEATLTLHDGRVDSLVNNEGRNILEDYKPYSLEVTNYD